MTLQEDTMPPLLVSILHYSNITGMAAVKVCAVLGLFNVGPLKCIWY
jgi:hypothetical protein